MLKLLIPAALFEGLMLLFISHSPSHAEYVAIYIAFHALGSILLAIALARQLPAGRGKDKFWAVFYLFVFNFVMPIIGPLCITAGYVIARRFPSPDAGTPFELVDEPCFTLHHNYEFEGFHAGQVRARLVDPCTPMQRKLEALVSLQDVPTHTTKELLRGLLSDSEDDIRLLAYGILDSKEKEITQRIHELLASLQHAQRDAERRELHKYIAELYWELIYQRLVEGDMLAFCAARVRHHAALVLQTHSDAGLWLLLARLELYFHRFDKAEAAMIEAQDSGLAKERLLPYFAELRYSQRRYADVSAALMVMPLFETPRMAPVLRYWLNRPASIHVEISTRSRAGTNATLGRVPSIGRASAHPKLRPHQGERIGAGRT